MFGAGRNLIKRLKGAVLREDGSSTIEFVILFPLIMFIFLSSFEISIYLTRLVLLDRAVDINVRLLRLGAVEDMTQAQLQQQICDDALIFTNCPTSVMVELRKVDTTTWNMPNPNATCMNRSEEIDPPEFATAGRNDLMVVRACAVLDPFFNTTPWVMRMPVQPGGGYAVIATSTFVNEP